MLDWILHGSLTTTLLVGLVTGLFVYWLIRKYRYKYPPAPWCPPLAGHLLQYSMDDLLFDVVEWSKKYGPVVTVQLGPVPMVFVNKIDAALDVLVKRSTDFANRYISTSVDMFTSGGKDIAFSNYGATWKLHRRIASKALRHYMQGPALHERVHVALETTFIEMDKKLGGEAFDNIEYINFIVGNILNGMCFGGKYNFEDKEVDYILEKQDALLQYTTVTLEDLIPALRYVYTTKAFKMFEDFKVEAIDGFLGNKYKTAQKTFDRDNIRHFTDNLILARLEAEEEEGSQVLKSLTDDHIIHTLSDIFFAGIDTSRYTLRFAILHMIAFPEIQEKVQQEIDAVVGKNRLPEVDDRPNLSYTEAVLHESMRMATVAPTGLMHATACDTEIAGYRIPKGTTVTINHVALHYDPDEWTEPHKFIPERYLDADGKLGPKPRSWLPFGAGVRACLGEFVAKPELHLLFASLMQRYKWKAEPGTQPTIEAITNIFARVPKAYKCIIEKRV